nr:DUF4286 family protein [uncultured Arsenicibacter sp.]
MLLYNVTVNISKNVAADWLQWIRAEHLPDIMATGLPAQHKLLELLTEIDNGGSTYTIQLLFPDQAAYDAYETIYAPKLHPQMQRRYAGNIYTFQTLLREI